MHRIRRTGRAGNKGSPSRCSAPKTHPCWRRWRRCSTPDCPSSGSRASEPDLTCFDPEPRRASKGAQKQKARKQALAGNRGGRAASPDMEDLAGAPKHGCSLSSRRLREKPWRRRPSLALPSCSPDQTAPRALPHSCYKRGSGRHTFATKQA